MKDNYQREIRYLRMSVTDLCNLRCVYCMPEDGVCKMSHTDILTENEMIAAVEAAASLGVNKLRITGGEPLVKKNIISILERCKAVPGIETLCITTNATLLAPMADDVRRAGVSRINISLDTLDPDKYRKITRVGSLDDAMSGIEAALACDFRKVKVNSVLIGGFNDDEIRNLAELTVRYPIDLRFIELMPMYDNKNFGPGAYISADIVKQQLPELVSATAEGPIEQKFMLPGAKGSVGLIRAISEPFCTKCDRIRLTADGKLKPCLHSGTEIPIKGLSREEMREKMIEAIKAKPECHSELGAEWLSDANRTMNRIGG